MNCENALELMNRELDEALTAEESAALKETERLAEPSPYRSLARERASAGEERLLSMARRSKRS